jgi:hypothetical protein
MLLTLSDCHCSITRGWPRGKIRLISGGVCLFVQASMGANGKALRYYSTPMHAAAFVLPEFCRKMFAA